MYGKKSSLGLMHSKIPVFLDQMGIILKSPASFSAVCSGTQFGCSLASVQQSGLSQQCLMSH